ncbi:hypothetical protein [Candidatus Nitrospira salsa]
MNRRMTHQLMCDVLMMGLFRHHFFPETTILPSDRGSQFWAKRYQRLLRNHRLRCGYGS